MGFVRCGLPSAAAGQFLEQSLASGSQAAIGRARQGFTARASATLQQAPQGRVLVLAALQQAPQLGRGQVQQRGARGV